MTEPPIYPLLMLPAPATRGREALRQGGPRPAFRRPSPAEQGQRLNTKFRALQTAIDERRATLTATLQGVDPELVLVFEIATTIDDFARAVARIPGFEFLAELDEDAIEDADQAFGPQDPESSVPGTMFLMATNQEALTAVLDMWNGFVRGDDSVFPRNFGRWREVFRHLLDIRRWSSQDRLRGTGIERDFAARIASGQEVVPAELELWYRDNGDRRAFAEATVRAVVEESGGSVLASADITEIAYHALLVTLPISEIHAVLEGALDDVALLNVEDLAFVRPQALVVAPIEGTEEAAAGSTEVAEAAVQGPPIVGVFDGVPMLGHDALLDRVIFDDPDGLEAQAEAHRRQHGTAVLSLVAHGDLATEGDPLGTPVYHRPLLVPEELFNGRFVERMPSDTLPIDLVFRAVRRMYEGEGGSPPVAPTVRVINLAIADASKPLATTISPWARLMDWLSHRYGVLFVISAGNHGGVMQYDQAAKDLLKLSERAFRIETFNSLIGAAHQRRLLSPSESMNALTVGASHDDASVAPALGSRTDLLPGARAGVEAPPGIMSSIGMGYRQSIKPDVLAPGGRLLFNRAPGSDLATPSLFHVQTTPSQLAPGILAAAPASSGRTDATWHVHGTSYAAAIVTHALGHVVQQLQELTDSQGNSIPIEEISVLAKALAVHSARIPESADELREVLAPTVSAQKMRSAVSRFYGYGIISSSRMRSGALTRVTLLGSGSLLAEEGHRYAVPLPPSLAGQVVDRQLTVTVASFVPTRARDHRHRTSDVYFIPDTATLDVKRSESDSWAVRHGAVQHEVLSGRRAAAFVDGDELGITVSCRSLVGAHREPSLYGLAVTLEVPEDVGLPIYTEVATRVRAAIEARARVRGARAR